MKIILNNKEIEVPQNTTIIDLVKQYSFLNTVVGVKVNNEIVPMNDSVEANDQVIFLYPNDEDGNKIYKSGLKFVLIASIYELFGQKLEVNFEHSIDKGICFSINNYKEFSDQDVKIIKDKMQEIISADLPITKVNVSKKDAITYYKKIANYEKAQNIQNVSNIYVHLYKLKKYYNYFYTSMPYSTGVLNKYDIVYLEKNKFVLLFPVIGPKIYVPTYKHYPLNMKAFEDYKLWSNRLGVKDVCDVNYLVSHNKIKDFIMMNELYFQDIILNTAHTIYNRKNIKVVFIAGPSSSGKTTTSKKLSLALETLGINILNISLDDYYLDQIQMPPEKVKNREFENLELLDLKLFNDNLSSILKKEEVYLPKYDFVLGKKVYDIHPTKINDQTIIIIEGLHALNDKLVNIIDLKKVYKIYVSPFQPLSIDRHNHMSTIDLRLLRRIVRDNQSRGVSPTITLNTWENVREGEEKNIFPFMGNVDTVINTSLIYEVGVLRVYVEPLLYSVDITSSAYDEAKRLIEFLKIFYPIPSEYISQDSFLREFIGGSIFK